MSIVDFKVSKPGYDISSTLPDQLVVSGQYGPPMCDLRPRQKHYGQVNFNITKIAANTTIILHQFTHGYDYIPGFLSAWSFPAGTDPNSLLFNNTFGIGDIDMRLNNGLYMAIYTDPQKFTISLQNSDPTNSVSNILGSIRFYVFAYHFVVKQSL